MKWNKSDEKKRYMTKLEIINFRELENCV